MRFSVIVPVYNVEDYLDKCIISILGQDYNDFEIILIDDGSTDKSGMICDEYQSKDERIHVVHKSNNGLSSARNTGIKEAKGDYLVFVDSDDWIDSNSLSAFDRIISMHHPEVIETKLVEEYEKVTVNKDEHFSEYLNEEFTRERAINWMLHESEDIWPAPKRICERDFIIQNNLFFAEGRLQEDIEWTTRLCCCARLLRGYDQPWYHYRMKRYGSITNTIHAKYITDVIEMAEEDRMLYNSEDSFAMKAFNAMMSAVYISINLYKHCNKNDKHTVKECIKKNMWIFDYTPTLKYRVFASMVRLIGIDISLWLLSVFC